MPEAKPGPVPELRFPEFREAGPWEVKRLGEAGRILTGKTPRTGDRESWNGEIPWITPTDIADAKRIATSARRLTKKGATAAGLLPKNTVLVTCIASIGKNAILDAPGSCNQQINAIIPKNDYDADFIFYLIERNRLAMMNLAGGSSPAIIPKSEFEKLRLPFPDLPEQQQIADCLTSLDDLIRAEEGRLGALKDHKRGLMQRLFPAPGQTTPRLRFPEFQNAGPWEVKSIADLSERIAQGGTPATSVAEYWNGGIPWITPAEMGDDAATHYTSATVRTISAEGLRNSSAELLPVNSVIISSRAPIGYVTINSVEMATNQGCKGIVPCADVHHEFLYFGLLNAKTRLNDIGAGAGFKEISTSSLAAFQIPVPSLPEQQQIADCLTSLDDLIRAQGETIEALKTHKRGLMNRLFPREVD